MRMYNFTTLFKKGFGIRDLAFLERRIRDSKEILERDSGLHYRTRRKTRDFLG